MSYNTTIQQGRFTQAATAVNKTISIRSDFDWIRVYNESAIIQAAANLGAEYYFQRGMTNGRGVVYTKLGAVANNPTSVGQIAASAGFTLLDTSGNPLGASVAITSATDITEPVFSTGSTAGVVAGTIVRLSGMTGQESLSGYDFAVDTIVADTSFKMAAALATAPGAAASAGNYRIVNFDPLFYPRHRFVVNILRPQDGGGTASSSLFTVSVPSGYLVGQKVRVIVPTTAQAGTSDYGMVEMNGLIGTVTAVTDTLGTQTVTLDIDSSAFTAFTFPTAAKAAKSLSKAMLVPVGEDTAHAIAQSQDILSDATDNQGLIGVTLTAGTLSPGGSDNDVVYWQAGKAFSVDND